MATVQEIRNCMGTKLFINCRSYFLEFNVCPIFYMKDGFSDLEQSSIEINGRKPVLNVLSKTEKVLTEESYNRCTVYLCFIS